VTHLSYDPPASATSAPPMRAYETPSNRSAGRDGIRRQSPTWRGAGLVARRACQDCGVDLIGRARPFCSPCNEARQEAAFERFTYAGVEALARQRANGRDPSHGGTASQKRGHTQARRAAERRAWEADSGNGSDQAEMVFEEEILPKLQSVPLSKIQQATGLSLRYVSLIRRGKCPHQRHLAALARLVGADS
jgi:hypothetical protein